VSHDVTHSVQYHGEDYVNLLRWWHRHYVRRGAQQADLIRNGVLQDIVALRRQLETATETYPESLSVSSTRRVLSHLENLYRRLEILSDTLAPPFQHDSLPLALQHIVNRWQHLCNWHVSWPRSYRPEAIDHIYLLIHFLDRVMQQLGDLHPAPQQCDLMLGFRSFGQQLHFVVSPGEALSGPTLTDIARDTAPVLKTFQLLTGGYCSYQLCSGSIAWIVTWPVRSDSNCPPHTP